MNPIWRLRMMKFSGSSPPCSSGEGQQQNYGSSQLPKPAAKALFWQHVTICQKSMISLTGKKLIYRIVLWDEGTKQESIPLDPFPWRFLIWCVSLRHLCICTGVMRWLWVFLLFSGMKICGDSIFIPIGLPLNEFFSGRQPGASLQQWKKTSYGNLRGFKMLPSYVGILS